MEKTIIKNIGTIVSGDIEQPIIEGTVVVVEDGKIAAIGYRKCSGNRCKRDHADAWTLGFSCTYDTWRLCAAPENA